MRLIVDTNQADDFRRDSAPADVRPTLVVPPLTWAEILLAPKQEDQRKAMANYDLRYGMDPPTIFAELARLPEVDIRTFDPVFRPDSDRHAKQLQGFCNPSDEHFKRARQLKQWAEDDTGRVIDWLAKNRKKVRDAQATAKSLGETVELVKWATITEADKRLFLCDGAPYRKWLIQQITEDDAGNGRCIQAASEETLFRAAWDNPAIRHFLRLRATIALGYAECWTNKKLNVPPARRRNDEPDSMLPLFAANGDVILTRDKKLERAIRYADPENRIKISTWPSWAS